MSWACVRALPPSAHQRKADRRGLPVERVRAQVPPPRGVLCLGAGRRERKRGWVEQRRRQAAAALGAGGAGLLAAAVVRRRPHDHGACARSIS
jgi:hypothetical protein